MSASSGGFELPDPATVTKWMGQVRAWIPVLMAMGVAVPNIPDGVLQKYVTLALIAAGLVSATWSWIEKRWQERAARNLAVDSAVASARTGTPILVAVTKETPAGQPNLGVAIPVAAGERATATIV